MNILSIIIKKAFLFQGLSSYFQFHLSVGHGQVNFEPDKTKFTQNTVIQINCLVHVSRQSINPNVKIRKCKLYFGGEICTDMVVNKVMETRYQVRKFP